VESFRSCKKREGAGGDSRGDLCWGVWEAACGSGFGGDSCRSEDDTIESLGGGWQAEFFPKLFRILGVFDRFLALHFAIAYQLGQMGIELDHA